MFRRVNTTAAHRFAGKATATRAFGTAASTGARAAGKSAFSWKRSAFAFTAGTAMAAAGTATVAFCFSRVSPPITKTPSFDYKGVRGDLEALLEDDLSVGPLLVRLAWHEAGTWDKDQKNGCPNSGSMRFAPESNHGANAGLDIARNLLEPIKKKHPNISYGDLWSLAAVVAIDAMGGPNIPWRFGRNNATSGSPFDGRLPDAAQTQGHIRDIFYRMGFNDREIVALIGAHTLGECHPDRSGFVGPWTHDRLGFDNSYYIELRNNDWILNKEHKQLQFKDSATGKLMMFPGDVALILDPEFKKSVEEFAKDQDVFHQAFASAFQKLLELGDHHLFYPAQ